jgi:hypothetical protein
MYLKALRVTTILAAPTIALEDAPPELRIRLLVAFGSSTSVITSKPAIHGHFKTGHMGARNVFFG